MSLIDSTELKEGGIFIHKYKETDTNLTIMVENKRNNNVVFTVDFEGSSNIKLKNSDGLHVTKTIGPFNSTIIANIILQSNSNINTHYKYQIKPPPKDMAKVEIAFEME